jgi:sugar lactone lactonase YvrE
MKYSTYFLITLTISLSKMAAAQELYVSSIFTPLNSFTSGAEGPAVDKSGMLYAVNLNHEGTIGQVSPDGNSSIFIKLPTGSIGNGIRFDSFGNMFIADYVKHNIYKVEMVTKQLSVFAHEPRMSQPNDIAIDNRDRLYASDPNWKDSSGRIWRICTDGKVTLLQSNMGTTNGIEISPDNKILYVNETFQRRVWAFDLSGEGQLSNQRLLIEFPDFGLDGMRSDVEGNLYITRHGKGTVVKISPKGKLLHEVKLHGKNPSNIAFGGEDGRTIFVTVQDAGNIETFRVEEPGREWKMQIK